MQYLPQPTGCPAFAATDVPTTFALAPIGVAEPPMSVPIDSAYSLSVGTDIGGSATPIGASANVVGTSVVSKAGHPVSWGKYCKSAIPATAIVLIISMIVIKLRYF